MIQDLGSTEKTFKVGDRVRLRSRFTHLYTPDPGVIVAVILDPMRSLFNEYTVVFPDESMATVFHFQIDLHESGSEDALQKKSA
jgi:hypothetical protein